MVPEDVVTKGMDMGDALRGETVETAITLTNGGDTSAELYKLLYVALMIAVIASKLGLHGTYGPTTVL